MKPTQAKEHPILLLHGWTMRGSVFDALSARLGPRCLTPDLPGHGETPNAEAGLDACVDALSELIDSTGRDDLVLVGWSMGALIAWSYIARYGTDRLAGLVSVDMSPRPSNSEGWSLGLRDLTEGRQRRATEEIHSDWPTAAGKIASTMFATRAGAPGFSRETAFAQVMSNDPKVMAQYWDEMMLADQRGTIPNIDIPWLVAYGANSRVYPPETAAWLANAAPDARKVEFELSGHSPHLEEPEKFATVLTEFADAL